MNLYVYCLFAQNYINAATVDRVSGLLKHLRENVPDKFVAAMQKASTEPGDKPTSLLGTIAKVGAVAAADYFIGSAKKMGAEEYTRIGNDHFSAKNYEEAIPFYAQSLLLEPSVPVFLARGNAYFHLGYYPLALQDYHHAIQLKRSAVLLQQRARAFWQLALYPDAFYDYIESVHLDPSLWNMFGLTTKHGGIFIGTIVGLILSVVVFRKCSRTSHDPDPSPDQEV